MQADFGAYKHLKEAIANAKELTAVATSGDLINCGYDFEAAFRNVCDENFAPLAAQAIARMESDLAMRKQAIIDEAARLAAE